jgi:hypothetical protein
MDLLIGFVEDLLRGKQTRKDISDKRDALSRLEAFIGSHPEYEEWAKQEKKYRASLISV